MRRFVLQLLAALAALLALAPAAQAQLPGPVQFGVRMEMGDIAQAREWLDAGLDPNFVADRIGTGLMIAAWEGNIPLMELFVARGADVNRSNAAGEQALLHAAWRGKLDAVKWLLEHGARLNREPMQWTALHYAVFAGHEEVAQYLIGRGADINARSTNGSSVLMMAVYEGHEALARKLVGMGADRSIRNDRGDGALEWAVKYKRTEIARVLGDAQQVAAAAGAPREAAEPRRTLPPVQATAPAVPGEIDQLLKLRAILSERGMHDAVERLDRRIAAARARPALEARSSVVLEIRASRRTPQEQSARLIAERGTGPAAAN